MIELKYNKVLKTEDKIELDETQNFYLQAKVTYGDAIIAYNCKIGKVFVLTLYSYDELTDEIMYLENFLASSGRFCNLKIIDQNEFVERYRKIYEAILSDAIDIHKTFYRKKKAMRQVRNSVARQESDDKMYNQDYNLLRPAIVKVKEILKSNYLKEEIKENADAGRYYAEILTNSVVSKDVSDSLQKINKNHSKVAYHIEINNKDNYSIITIYIANITEAASEFISFEETDEIDSIRK